MDGLILVRKPPSLTSHDVVGQMREILSFQKIGHFGTLDPQATGLLLVAVGKGTRFFHFFSRLDKVYQGRIRLGVSTDTYDSSGVPTGEGSERLPCREDLVSAMRAFEGVIEQTPPPYSAKKLRGKPLYAFAREKTPTVVPPSRRTVHYFRLVDYAAPDLEFEVKCSSGTYVRALAHDLGARLGCGAHLAELVRTAIGDYKLDGAFSLEEVQRLSGKGRSDEFLQPLETFLPTLPKILLTESGQLLIQAGRPVLPEDLADPLSGAKAVLQEDEHAVFRLFSPEGRLIALARKGRATSSLRPILVLT